MRKSFLSAVLLGASIVSAHAADLGVDSFKDPLPDTLTYKGVTFYGVIDIGYGYETSGAPLSGAGYWGQNYNVWAAPPGRGAYSSLTTNAMDLSMIGLKIEEDIGYGWKVIGKLESGFDPLSGEIDDACQTIIRNNGKPASQQTSNGDAVRCGQFINGSGYAGVTNAAYGTLTAGRQNSLAFNTFFAYDPNEVSFAFSLVGWGGGFGGGSGATETLRWDNSIKYAYQYGPVHATVMFAQGEQDSALHGNSYAGNIGATWNGFSVDAVYTAERDAVNAGGYGVGGCGVSGTPSCNTLSVTAQNSDAWVLAGKYVYDFGGGLKDGGPSTKLTFYGGFEHIRISDPSDPLSVGDTTIGGYIIGQVTNTAYLYGDQNLDVAWAGAKYETGPWSFTGAYYRVNQNFYKTSAASVSCSSSAAFNCSGAIDTASATVDYTFTKHFDVYAGVSWSGVSGGFANGYNVTDNTAFATGLRLKF